MVMSLYLMSTIMLLRSLSAWTHEIIIFKSHKTYFMIVNVICTVYLVFAYQLFISLRNARSCIWLWFGLADIGLACKVAHRKLSSCQFKIELILLGLWNLVGPRNQLLDTSESNEKSYQRRLITRTKM